MDLEKIKSPQFREQLAVALLNGIQKYILAKESGKLIMGTTYNKDTVIVKDVILEKVTVKDVVLEKVTLNAEDKERFAFQNSINRLSKANHYT